MAVITCSGVVTAIFLSNRGCCLEGNMNRHELAFSLSSVFFYCRLNEGHDLGKLMMKRMRDSKLAEHRQKCSRGGIKRIR